MVEKKIEEKENEIEKNMHIVEALRDDLSKKDWEIKKSWKRVKILKKRQMKKLRHSLKLLKLRIQS